jgi:hypothetical protein
MSGEQKTVLLNGGRECQVALVDGATGFMTGLLGGATAKTGTATLRVVKNNAAEPFVAVFIGGKHVGFVSRMDAPGLLPALASCEQEGAMAQARGLVTTPSDAAGAPAMKLSLAQPGQLLTAKTGETPLPSGSLPAPPRAEPASRPGPAQTQPTEILGLPSRPSSGPATLGLGLAPIVVPAIVDGPRQLYPGSAGNWQTTTYCPRCGAPLQNAGSRCRCEYVWDARAATVVGDRLVGRSPMVLPCGCVVCGKDAANGRRINRTLYACPFWIILVILFSLLLGVIVYLIARKPLELSYSLCSECAQSRATKRWIAIGGWLLFVLLVAAAIATGSMLLVILMIVAFVGALTMSVLAGSRLRVSGYQAGVFTVKGAGPTFLTALGRSVS